MTSNILVWLQLGGCALVIFLAGPFLVHYAERISTATGLSQSWIGLFLLATATSLPELVTGISSVTVAGAPDIAVGDALGSCVYNLLLLVLLDAFTRDESVYGRIDQRHILTAGFGVVMLALVGMLMLVARDDLDLRLFHVSIYSPFLIVLYFVAMRAAFFYDKKLAIMSDDPPSPTEGSLGGAVRGYAMAAIVVVTVGIWLPFIGQQIAQIMAWETSFVGTLFIAGTTSLPELVVVITAMRLGRIDMAIAGLLGSNLFDILIIALDDIAYTDGSIYAAVSPVHAVSALAAVMMSGIFTVALLYRPGNRFFGMIGWVSIALITVFLLSSYILYLQGV
ncbi:MAG: sodium:calcium antiporter [Parasphingorhabdus sp.]|uniref:sodium:calcium antiporter n=1 Tax=Parasphingorhabdus sp. TaxID=2709688 RepID=UPI0030021E1B